MRKPNFFIVGAPRCGTSSLWSYLKAHPEIFMSEEKELYFFDTDLRASGWVAPSLQQYLTNFAAAGDRRIVGEATPSYLRSERAAAGIKALNAEARIVIMLRNPVDVMHSLHNAALYAREPLADFEAALEADARRRGSDRIGYREFTDFPAQVRRYLNLFGGGNVHVIIFDDLKESPGSVYRNTLQFLRVNLPDTLPEFKVVNPNRNVRNLRWHQNVAHPPGMLRHIARVLVPPRLRARVQHSLFKSNRSAGPRQPMDPRLRKRLQREIKPQVKELGSLLGMDLSGWCVEPSE